LNWRTEGANSKRQSTCFGKTLLPKEIMRALKSDHEGLAETFAAASGQRTAKIPLFMQELERCLTRSPKRAQKPIPLIYILLLVGEWGEQSVFETIAQLVQKDTLRFRDDGDLIDFAELCEPFLHRVIAATYNGNPQPLFDIMRNHDLSLYNRVIVFHAIVTLVYAQKLSRADVTDIVLEAVPIVKRDDPHSNSFEFDSWHNL